MIAGQKKIDDYLLLFPDDVQLILSKIRLLIQQTVPQAAETISYGIPTFDMNGKHLLHFAGFKNHIGLFPTSSVVIAFKDELTGYKTSKGTIQFKLNEPIPYDLIKKIVKFRVAEVK